VKVRPEALALDSEHGPPLSRSGVCPQRIPLANSGETWKKL